MWKDVQYKSSTYGIDFRLWAKVGQGGKGKKGGSTWHPTTLSGPRAKMVPDINANSVVYEAEMTRDLMGSSSSGKKERKKKRSTSVY